MAAGTPHIFDNKTCQKVLTIKLVSAIMKI